MRTKFLLVSLALLAALALSACAPAIAPSSTEASRTLSVTGTGQVYVTPDIAYLNIGVHTEMPNASDAVSENNAQTAKVIEALKKAGVDAKDIRTSNFSIWSFDKYDPASGVATGEKYYAVDNTVYVTVRSLDKLGVLLDTVVRAGANNINSIQFDVADKTKAMQEARAAAVKNATDLAQELAGLAGVSLVEITNINFSESAPYVVYAEYGRGGGGAAPQAAIVPIEPGQMTLTATVSVTYEIK